MLGMATSDAEIKDPGMVGHFKCGEMWPWRGWPRQMLKLMSDAFNVYGGTGLWGAL